MTAEGLAVILLGDTLEEVIGLSSRILVMRDGEVTASFDAPPGGKPTQVELVEAYGVTDERRTESPGSRPICRSSFWSCWCCSSAPTIRPSSRSDNFLSVTADTMTLFLMASGVTFVIMIGGIDLSVQAVASMASCILAAYLDALRYLRRSRLRFSAARSRDLPAASSRPSCAFPPSSPRLPSAASCSVGRLLVFGHAFDQYSAPIFRPAISSGRSATRSAFPMRSGSAQSCWSC